MIDYKQIAKTAHEVNRMYCLSIGDNSQPTWEDAPQWQKDSALNGVSFHMENDVTPEQSHENWLLEKQNAGWRYGPVKDPEKKEHPCFVAYNDLPKEQRVKDYLFKAVVDSFK
ncbi:RyR domain-containing protein [Shouchella tritolerans]|uniref:RyR domain-containing protein n=1 Tax=Shouchella tritolerans TaxID=2979466 RepID=UPI0021E934ED|nr:RyR domain-containing protein [Shouchella tritolerans]